ncbi:MAG: hypothetical protein AMXMBFR57_05230 [Acidimicrobiia bacterium]
MRQALGWLLIVAATADGVLRQLARWSPAQALSGQPDISPWWNLVPVVVGLLCLLVGTRASRLRTWGIAVALFAAGASAQVALGARLQSDGFFYYAFTRSIWFDHDLDLTNDYALLGIDDPQHQFLLEPTVTGYAQSAWAIGPALAWSPFVGIGHLSATVLASQGVDVKTDGTSYPYRQAVALAGLAYGLFGLWCSYRLTRLWCPPHPALLATVAIASGTFLLWYLVREPTMSHTVSMASVAAFTWAWMRWRTSGSARQWFLLGLLGGVMVIMRWQNALVLIVPGLLVARQPRLTAAMAGGVLLGALPQMWTWHALYGEWITQPPVSPRLLWWQSQWIDVLWSSRSGLFAMSPLAYLGAIGLIPLWRRHRLLAVMGALTLIAITWTNGAVEDWWAGASFGGRRFDSTLPFLVSGLAALGLTVTAWVQRHPVRMAAALLSLLVLWNVTLMAVARSGVYRLGTIVSFGDLAAEQARVAQSWMGHPASWPANLIWAAANGVGPARFDLLRPNRFLGDPTRPYGRVDIGSGDDVYVLDGWYGPESVGDVTFRWADQSAGVVVPLTGAAPLFLQVQVTPFEAAGLDSQVMTARVNGHDLPAVTLAAGWQRIEIPTEASVWQAGLNRVVLTFARATRPLDVGGSDGRALAAAVDYIRIQKR